jgi:mono/diheme cytochrome c family protein
MRRLASVTLLAGLVTAGCEWVPSDGTGGVDTDNGPPARQLGSAEWARGQALYNRHCQVCHGEAGTGRVLDWRIRDGDGHLRPPPLDGSANAWRRPTVVLMGVIRDGSPAGEGKMPAWNEKFSERDMRAVVTYIKSLWSEPVYRLWWNVERQSLKP